MSTGSKASNPLPDTESAVVGGPAPRESAMPGSTLKLVELVAVPLGPVTLIWLVVASVGTVARIDVLETTVNEAEAPPKNTPVAPVNPEPVIVTTVPSAPCVGENDVIDGAAQ